MEEYQVRLVNLKKEGIGRALYEGAHQNEILVAQWSDGKKNGWGLIYDKDKKRWNSVSGVNITLGLPIIRTSVDHGTAFDAAWKGVLSPDSLRNAVDYAVRMASSGLS